MEIFDREKMLVNMSEVMGTRLQLERLKGGRILDLGCGVGATAIHLANKFPNIQIVGLTIAEKQIDIGNELIRKAGVGNRVSLVHADYTDMPDELGDAFDGAYALESGCYARMDDKRDLIQAAGEKLSVGARIVFADGFRRHSRPLSPILDRCYRSWCDGWEVPHLADIGKFKIALETNGFKDVVIEDISWRVAPSAIHGMGMSAGYAIMNLLKGNMRALEYGRKNAASAFLTGVLGLDQRDFGYFIVTGTKT